MISPISNLLKKPLSLFYRKNSIFDGCREKNDIMITNKKGEQLMKKLFSY